MVTARSHPLSDLLPIKDQTPSTLLSVQKPTPGEGHVQNMYRKATRTTCSQEIAELGVRDRKGSVAAEGRFSEPTRGKSSSAEKVTVGMRVSDLGRIATLLTLLIDTRMKAEALLTSGQ